MFWHKFWHHIKNISRNLSWSSSLGQDENVCDHPFFFSTSASLPILPCHRIHEVFTTSHIFSSRGADTLSFNPSLLFFWEWFVNGQEMIYECILHFHSCLETWLIKENKLARNVGEWTKRVNWSYISYVVGGGGLGGVKKTKKCILQVLDFYPPLSLILTLTLFLSWCHVLVIITFKLTILIES